MRTRACLCSFILAFAFVFGVRDAWSQAATDESRFTAEVAIGMDFSVGGDVNSGAIGRLQGQATAILPQPYGQVYGTGFQARFGGGYAWRELTELRAMFIWQKANADLVRLGDLGPSSLYGQYSDYQNLSLDFGLRRYFPTSNHSFRFFGEASIGIAFIDNIDVQFAAPQSNAVFDDTDFYDRSAAFTWSLGGGVLFPVAKQIDITAQIGLRHASGLAEVDQFVGTGLESINDNSGRLTFPVVVGARFRF